MSDPSPAARALQLLLLPVREGGESVLEHSRRKATLAARRLALTDPEGAASDAVIHLLDKLQRYHHLFYQEDGSIHLYRLLAWRSRLLRNRLLELADRQRADRVLPMDPFDLYAMAAPSEDPPPVEAPDEPLLLRDAMVLHLQAILAMKPAHRELLLAARAGFTRAQLERLGYTAGSQSVILYRLKDAFRQPVLTQIPLEKRLYSPVDDDEPLATADTPFLLQALRDLHEPPGTALLEALLHSPPRERLPYLCRLADLWDCAIATVLDTSLEALRGELARLRQSLEERLRQEHRPGHGSSHPGSREEMPMSKAESRPAALGLLASEPSPANRLARLRLALLSQQTTIPADGLLELTLADPAREAAAHQARQARAALMRRLDVQGSPATQLELASPPGTSLQEEASSPSRLTERLWQRAKEWRELPAFILRPAPTQEVVRGSLETPSSAGLPAEPTVEALRLEKERLVLSFGKAPQAQADRHVMVWQKSGERLLLLYPRFPGDPTRARLLEGRRFMSRGPAEAGTLELILVQTGQAPGGEGEEALRAVLVSLLETEADQTSGSALYRLTLETHYLQ